MMLSHLRLFLRHRKVELILVTVCSLLLQPGQSILLRVVVPGTLDIVGMFFEDTKF